MKPQRRPIVTAAIHAVPGLIRDLVGLAGVASVSYGAWLAWPPAGFIVGGALVLAGVLLSARNDATPPADIEA